ALLPRQGLHPGRRERLCSGLLHDALESPMLKALKLAALAAMFTLSACVTINVYFPAAEAEQAAREFVEKVIGDEATGSPTEVKPADGGGMASIGGAVLDFLVP